MQPVRPLAPAGGEARVERVEANVWLEDARAHPAPEVPWPQTRHEHLAVRVAEVRRPPQDVRKPLPAAERLGDEAEVVGSLELVGVFRELRLREFVEHPLDVRDQIERIARVSASLADFGPFRRRPGEIGVGAHHVLPAHLRIIRMIAVEPEHPDELVDLVPDRRLAVEADGDLEVRSLRRLEERTQVAVDGLPFRQGDHIDEEAVDARRQGAPDLIAQGILAPVVQRFVVETFGDERNHVGRVPCDVVRPREFPPGEVGARRAERFRAEAHDQQGLALLDRESEAVLPGLAVQRRGDFNAACTRHCGTEPIAFPDRSASRQRDMHPPLREVHAIARPFHGLEVHAVVHRDVPRPRQRVLARERARAVHRAGDLAGRLARVRQGRALAHVQLAADEAVRRRAHSDVALVKGHLRRVRARHVERSRFIFMTAPAAATVGNRDLELVPTGGNRHGNGFPTRPIRGRKHRLPVDLHTDAVVKKPFKRPVAGFVGLNISPARIAVKRALDPSPGCAPIRVLMRDVDRLH